MTKTSHGKARALAAVLVIAMGTGMLSGCEFFRGLSNSSSSDFPQTSHWDAEKGQYVTEENPNYREGGGGGD